jgi:5-methylcytosine-specific restriction endonuclease McrA
MSKLICYDIFPRQKDNVDRMSRLLTRHGFVTKTNQYGTYFHAEVGKWDSFHIKNIILCHNFKYKKYEKRWDRSDNYRSEFFKHYKGPYRCAYCGRRINSSSMEIDHLVPVSKAKSNGWARFMLKMNTIYNVNDYRNLVPSCKRCNRKKSDNMGLWVIIGSIGRHRIFWNFVDLILLGLIIAAVLFVAAALGVLGELSQNILALKDALSAL